MPIYDHKYGGLDYFRVYRSWGGKEYQEYVRIGEDRAEARRKAEAIEARLDEAHDAYLRKLVSEAGYHVRDDGTVKGLRRITVARDERAPVEVLELRINVPWTKKVRRTTISVTNHGFDQAYSMAVTKIKDWYELEDDSPAVSAMMESRDHYALPSELSGLKAVASLAKNEFETLTQGVFKGLKKFKLPKAS